MLSRVIAKNVGDVFFETQCSECFHCVFKLKPGQDKCQQMYRRGQMHAVLKGMLVTHLKTMVHILLKMIE